MRKKTPVKCRLCKQMIDRNVTIENVDWVMPSRNYFYHKKCYEDWIYVRQNASITSTEYSNEFWHNLLLDYLLKDVKLPNINYQKINSQWNNFIKQGKTPKGIFFATKYCYEIQHNNLQKAEGGIGLISYIYQDACQYWVEKENQNRGYVDGIIQQMLEHKEQSPVHFHKKEKNNHKKKQYSFDEIELEL